MSIIDDSTKAMIQLHQLTSGMKNGSVPDAVSILGIQSDLVDFYRQIGEEMSQKFGVKESAYLNRKIAEANEYRKGRLNPDKKIADVSTDALLAVGEEFQREIDSAEEYERYRTFLRSLQNALDYARSVASFVKTSESQS